MYLNLNFVTLDQAQQIANRIYYLAGGYPTENRVLILSPKDQEIKQGKIIIPGHAEEIPNKGVIILPGNISEEYKHYVNLVDIGRIVTYGRYAGKEIDFDPSIFKDIKVNLAEQKFTVLDLNEIIFTENNK